jgi:hypothetical protein
VTALRDVAARALPSGAVLRSIAKWADWTPPPLAGPDGGQP